MWHLNYVVIHIIHSFKTNANKTLVSYNNLVRTTCYVMMTDDHFLPTLIWTQVLTKFSHKEQVKHKQKRRRRRGKVKKRNCNIYVNTHYYLCALKRTRFHAWCMAWRVEEAKINYLSSKKSHVSIVTWKEL